MKPRKQTLIIASSVLWLGLVLSGFAYLEGYASEPGQRGAAPSHWPASSQLQLAQNAKTLLMFVHPHCACSAASLAELERIIVGKDAAVKTHIIFILPDDQDDGWQETKLWRRAQEVPGVTLHTDRGGQEADLFGSETSGHAFLFNADGVLLFDGGITSSRGHEGSSTGRSSVESLIRDEDAQASTPIFGCSLWDRVLKQLAGSE